MTFSDTVAQQREQHEKALKRFVTYSLAGSFVLHGVALCLKVNNLWQPEQVEPEIAIVVTEPSEENLAEVLSPEDSSSELSMESGFEASSSGSEEAGAATIVEASASGSPEEEPAVEEEPEPEPTPVPVAEDVEESVTEELVEEELAEEEVAEEPLPELTEEVAEATEPRALSDFLGELRRARAQARQTAVNGHSTNSQVGTGTLGNSGTSNPGGNGLGGNSAAAVGTGGLGDDLGTGTGSGNGRETGTDEGNRTGDDDRPQQGSRSREVSCRNCDFDYPESADGAEGTAQVVVETDAQGRVVSVTLSGSTGNAELDRAALEQARERVRLQGARAGESYPIVIDFVQPNSEAEQRVRERGDRRSITVSDPEPATAETPSTTSNQSPESEPGEAIEPAATPEPEPSANPTPESEPTRATDAEQPDYTNTPEQTTEPDTPPDAPTPAPIPTPTPRPLPTSNPSLTLDHPSTSARVPTLQPSTPHPVN
ncbi:MAG: TonB family protein, partial [Leptolyngbyaceae cyanobacterium RM1_405_57]|nr:TonB family protein [Leptolyngbyaceae cyanobacterium RM1_405_57]